MRASVTSFIVVLTFSVRDLVDNTLQFKNELMYGDKEDFSFPILEIRNISHFARKKLSLTEPFESLRFFGLLRLLC